MKDYLNDCKEGKIKPETIKEIISEKLSFISQKLDISKSEVYKKVLEIYPELEEVV